MLRTEIRELLAHAGGDALDDGRSPPQLVRLVADRLDRLSPAATSLARAVAVLGADAEEARARTLAGLEPSEAIAAEGGAARRACVDARAYARTRPVVAAAAREAMGPMDAAALHARAAALLADAGLDDQRVAEHLMRAPPRGDPAVVAALRRAADAARRLGALPTAARLLERAAGRAAGARMSPTPSSFERGRALRDAGEDHGGQVLARVAQQAPDPSLRVAAARHLAMRLALGGQVADAVAVLRAVIGDAARLPPRGTARAARRARLRRRFEPRGL